MFKRHFDNKEFWSAEIDDMEKRLAGAGSPVVFCHNDLLPGNIIWDQKVPLDI